MLEKAGKMHLEKDADYYNCHAYAQHRNTDDKTIGLVYHVCSDRCVCSS